MENQILNSGKRIRHLMDMHKPKIKTEIELSKAMHDSGILEYSTNPRVTRDESIRNKGKAIRNHLKGGKIDVEWLKRYCDFFECSADYLLGYISGSTHEATNIMESTGLWEESLNVICEEGYDLIGSFLNPLITSKEFHDLCITFEELTESVYTRNEFAHELQDSEKQIQELKDKGEKVPVELWEDFYEAGGFWGGHGDSGINSDIYRMGIKFGTFLENFKDNDIEFIKKLYWGEI